MTAPRCRHCGTPIERDAFRWFHSAPPWTVTCQTITCAEPAEENQ